MFVKFFALPFSLFLLMVTSCFAETAEISTTEPLSRHLGMKIDLLGRDFIEKITIDKDKFLLVNKELTDVRIKKDTTNDLNKFSALVAYNLYVKNAKPSATRFLYVQCPVTRETYIDRSLPPSEVMIDGVMRLGFSVDHDVLKEEFLSLGSYLFLSSPDDKVPLVSNNFPMVGKVSQNLDIEVMCLQVLGAYDDYQWSEIFRKITLEKFDISE